MDLDKLTSLIKKREELCSIQRKLYNAEHSIQLVWHGYCCDLPYALESSLAEALKVRAKEFYHDEIDFVNKKIEEICKEENTQCLNQIN